MRFFAKNRMVYLSTAIFDKSPTVQCWSAPCEAFSFNLGCIDQVFFSSDLIRFAPQRFGSQHCSTGLSLHKLFHLYDFLQACRGRQAECVDPAQF